MADSELSEYQRAKQRISKEDAKAKKTLKVVEDSITYHAEGNKIIKTFKKTNGAKHTLFIGFKTVVDKKSPARRKMETPIYQKLKKEGLLK